MPYAILVITIVAVGLIQRHRVTRAIDWVLDHGDRFLESRGKRATRDGLTAAVLIGPALVILGIFGAAPLAYAIYLSLRSLDFGNWNYVGIAHYREALANEEFWRSLLVTAYFVAVSIPVSIGISFLVAWLLFRIRFGRDLFRTVYFLPYVTSAVAAATVWRVLLRPQLGGVNGLLQWAGVDPQRWLLEPRGVLSILTDGWVPVWVGPSLALCCIIAFEIWHNMGFMIVVLLAGLTAIPRELEDAARIDGAGRRQVLRHIVLPLLSPIVFFLTVTSTVHAMQTFNSFFALTGGARRLDTQNVMLLIYAQVYENQRFGYGAAIAVMVSAGIIVLTLIQWRIGSRKVHVE